LGYNSRVPSARSPELIYRVFGRRLRKFRKQKGLPQQELATLSGLSRASIANIENGKQRVLVHQLLQFADALGVEVSALVPEKADFQRIGKKERPRELNAYLEAVRKLTARA
jgi:transcriptional regulator with XRE-family HTH domain